MASANTFPLTVIVPWPCSGWSVTLLSKAPSRLAVETTWPSSTVSDCSRSTIPLNSSSATRGSTFARSMWARLVVLGIERMCCGEPSPYLSR